jgi:hypothetical protein
MFQIKELYYQRTNKGIKSGILPRMIHGDLPFSLNLDSLERNNEYLISVRLKIFGISKTPKALLITQVKDETGIISWRRAEIYSQVDSAETWSMLYANHFIDKELSSQQNLIFQSYLWNINNDDFYIDDFEVVVSKL